MISCVRLVKKVLPNLLASTLIGAFAALVATFVSALTSAALSPVAGALLGAAFGATAGRITPAPSTGSRRIGATLFRAVVAGGTAATVVLLLQSP
jgi:hypothetical protein